MKTVITRHKTYVEYALEIELIKDGEYEVIEHATPETVKDKDIIGILPHSLSCLTKSFTEIPVNLPPELRGKELTIEQMRMYAQPPVTYKISKLN